MLLEVVVAIVIILILAAAIAPAVVNSIDAARIDQSSKMLADVAAAAQKFDDDIGSSTGTWTQRSQYPGELTQLVTRITTSQRNVCGRLYTLTKVALWNGPYLAQSVPPTGLKTGIGTINNATVLLNVTTMSFRIPGVTWEDAVALNDKVDGDGNTATGSPTGSVRFGAADANGLVTLDYAMPIQSC